MPGFVKGQKIANDLRRLNCSGLSFVKLARSLGSTIASGSFSEGLSGKRNFDRATEERLLEVLQRIKSLQAEVDLPLDWSQTERIATALTTRLVAEIDSENSELQQMAVRATKSFEVR